MELEGNNPHSCFCGRGRVRSVQRPEAWSQSHWISSHNWPTRTTWSQYYNVCRHFREWREHTYSTHWALKYQLLLAFLNTLYRDLIPEQERGFVRPHLPNYVVVWDNVSFHRSNIVRDCLAAHERITVEFLPPYSPFLNPIEEFFQYMIIDHKNAACEDITADHCRGWCGIQGDFLTGAWQWKTSDVMLRKIFDPSNKSDMSTKNIFFHGCYFVYLW